MIFIKKVCVCVCVGGGGGGSSEPPEPHQDPPLYMYDKVAMYNLRQTGGQGCFRMQSLIWAFVVRMCSEIILALLLERKHYESRGFSFSNETIGEYRKKNTLWNNHLNYFLFKL